MSKKGVTLVEVIAVIVILGIITLIAVPTIGNLINRTRQNADQAIIDSLNQATEYYILMENIVTSDAF